MPSSHDIHRELPPASSHMQPTDSDDGGSTWQPDTSFDPLRFHYAAPQSFPQESPTNNNELDIYLSSPIQAGGASRSSEHDLDFRTTRLPPFPFNTVSYNPPASRHGPSDIHIDTAAAHPASPQFPMWLGYSPGMSPTPALSGQHGPDPNFHQQSPIHLSPGSTSTPSGEGSYSPSYPNSPSSSLHLSPDLQSLSPPLTPGSQSYQLVNSSPGGSGGSPFSNNSIDLPQQVFGPLEKKAKQLYTHHNQVQFFKHVSVSAAAGSGPFVQQRMYKPHTNSDRRRYVEDVDLEYPIMFWSEHPQECGIPLNDALHSRIKRLLHRDETVFEGRGPSVSIRFEWPGYRQWSRQIPTKDFRSPPGPITRAKLAKNVAKCVSRFINEKQNRPLEEEADERWRVGNNIGPGQIKLEDLILVSLHHVSMGSWQPHLKLRRPLR